MRLLRFQRPQRRNNHLPPRLTSSVISSEIKPPPSTTPTYSFQQRHRYGMRWWLIILCISSGFFRLTYGLSSYLVCLYVCLSSFLSARQWPVNLPASQFACQFVYLSLMLLFSFSQKWQWKWKYLSYVSIQLLPTSVMSFYSGHQPHQLLVDLVVPAITS